MTAVHIISLNKRTIIHLHNYGGMPFLMNFMLNAFIIILSRFAPHLNEIIVDQQY
jgi:hypothetical protein